MESSYLACYQNHAQAQNAYDSAQNHLKKGVQQPIFLRVPEVKPPHPEGASILLPRARKPWSALRMSMSLWEKTFPLAPNWERRTPCTVIFLLACLPRFFLRRTQPWRRPQFGLFMATRLTYPLGRFFANRSRIRLACSSRLTLNEPGATSPPIPGQRDTPKPSGIALTKPSPGWPPLTSSPAWSKSPLSAAIAHARPAGTRACAGFLTMSGNGQSKSRPNHLSAVRHCLP